MAGRLRRRQTLTIPHDLLLLVRGPLPLRERMAQPCWALMMAAGNAAARDWTWKNLQPTVAAARPGAADLGEMQP
jgi:hypothetical protein